MKEIPILYSTTMVQATIAGRKTKTRRTRGLEKINENPDDWIIKISEYKDVSDYKNIIVKDVKYQFYYRDSNKIIDVECPYGNPGDLLWVREKFLIQNGNYKFFADNTDWDGIFKFKPSIHMPKAAARIWLQVVSINLERLHDITEADAIAEGVEIGKGLDNKNWYKDYMTNLFQLNHAKTSFNSLWRYINGEVRNYSNPWVWVVEFKVVSKTGKPC